MGKSAAAEKGQTVNVADREAMALVEIRTGAIVGYVVGINENVGGPVRGIVNGVAVSVGHAQRQSAHRAVAETCSEL